MMLFCAGLTGAPVAVDSTDVGCKGFVGEAKGKVGVKVISGK